jgi:hypothetical protein
VIPRESRFVDHAVAKIEAWISSPAEFSQLSVAARARFDSVSGEFLAHFERVFVGKSETTESGEYT